MAVFAICYLNITTTNALYFSCNYLNTLKFVFSWTLKLIFQVTITLNINFRSLSMRM